MDKISTVLRLIVPLLIMLVVGFVFKRKKIITNQGIKDIKSIIINICVPAVIFTAFYNATYNQNTGVILIIIFCACTASLFAGFGLRKLFKINQQFLPYLITGMESGMLGYALFALLFGAQNTGYFAVIDFGQEIFIFTVYITLLNIKNKGAYSFKMAGAGLIKSPPFIAIVLGLVVGITGLGKALNATEAGAVVAGAVSFMSAPISALILIVIGFGIEFSRKNVKLALQAISLRAASLFGLCIAAYFILALFMPVDGPLKWALILLFILPPPFVLPIFVKKEEEQCYIATTLSMYTLFSIIAFTIVAFLIA